MKRSLLLFACLTYYSLSAQHLPTMEEVISLRSVGGLTMSPDGKQVAFSVQTTDWNENRYDNEIWLTKQGKKPFQLTNTAKGRM